MIEIENLYDYSVVPMMDEGPGFPLPRETRIKNHRNWIDNCIHRIKVELSESIFDGFGPARLQVVNGSGIDVVFMFISGSEYRQDQARRIVEIDFEFKFLVKANQG